MDGWVIKGVSKVAIAYKSHLHRYNSYTESYYLGYKCIFEELPWLLYSFAERCGW